MSGQYRQLLDAHRKTGIHDRDTLQPIGTAVGAGYLAQPKLAGFSRGSQKRVSVLGIRLFQTFRANIRLFPQIRDGAAGSIAWEGTDEMNYAYDTDTERPVTFRAVVTTMVRRLVRRRP